MAQAPKRRRLDQLLVERGLAESLAKAAVLAILGDLAPLE